MDKHSKLKEQAEQIFAPPVNTHAYYYGYYVSTDGKIYNKKGRRLSPIKSIGGTWVCSLYINGKRKTMPVNRILFQAWHPEMDISKCRVISDLDNDWLIDSGFSDEPDFNLYDLYLVPLVEGGKKPERRNVKISVGEIQNMIDLLESNASIDVEIVKEKLQSMLS